MKTFRELTEAKETIVFAFGRFNPPTTGHEKLIEACKKVAGSNEFRIYPSFTQKPATDPLPHSLKVAYMRKMFKKYARNIKADKSAKTAIMIAESIYKEGYKNLIMVAGSDRVAEFTRLLTTYNGQPDRKGNILYDFDSVKVVSAGERDPDAEGVTGMSASKMRAAATENEFEAFKMGVPSGFGDARKLFDDVRKHMGIREERDMGVMDSYEEMRDAYLTGKMWNVGSSIDTEHGSGEVVRKGTNYITYMTEDGKVHKSWLQDIAERNYKKEYANYQGKPEQIERRSSRNKARRAMGDKAVKGMDVGHKDNDPMNNDPSNLRNEDPSKNRAEPRYREEGKLPPHLAKFFDKKGNLKPDAAKRMQKGRSKKNWKDVTPKGFGPKEEFELNEAVLPFTKVLKKNKKLVKYVDSKKMPFYIMIDNEQLDKLGETNSQFLFDKLKKNKGAADVGERDVSFHFKTEKDVRGFKSDLYFANSGGRYGKLELNHYTDSFYFDEEVELDELSSVLPWLDKAVAKISQIRHPTGWENMVKAYVNGMKDKENQKHPSAWAAEIARQTKGVEGRDLVRYINKLVDKGKLPKELKAGYEPELDPIVEGLTMMVRGTKTTSQRKYQLTFGQKIKVDGKVWDTEGVTKMQVLPLTAGRDKKVLSKAEIESGLKDGSVEIVDVGKVWQPEGYVPEAKMSPLGRLQKWDREKNKSGIFKDKGGKKKWYRMNKPGLKSIMNVPEDELKKYLRQGWQIIDEAADFTFKDLVERINLNQYISEKLPANADQGDYIKDFEKSDAPQFKGKSKEKRKEMAIAAYQASTRGEANLPAMMSKSKLMSLLPKPHEFLPKGAGGDLLKKVNKQQDKGRADYKDMDKTTSKKWTKIKNFAEFVEQDEPEENPEDAINALKFDKIPPKPVEGVDGDWKNIDIDPPHENASQATKNEMDSIRGETLTRTEEDVEKILMHDEPKGGVTQPIRKYMDDNDLEYDDATVRKIVEIGAGVGRFYKNKFQRARPWDLTEPLGIDMEIMEPSEPTMTPAYPSNHSLQSRLVAEYYGKKYREHYEELVKAADQVGFGRIKAGWHFPSDHQAGVKIAEHVAPLINLNR